MPEDKDMPPILRIDAGNGRAYYPRFHKNEKGEWELNDKSFRTILKHQSNSKEPAKTEKD